MEFSKISQWANKVAALANAPVQAETKEPKTTGRDPFGSAYRGLAKLKRGAAQMMGSAPRQAVPQPKQVAGPAMAPFGAMSDRLPRHDMQPAHDAQQGQFAHQNFASDWHRDVALLGGGPADGRRDPVDADRQAHQDFMAAMSGQRPPLAASADRLPRHDLQPAHDAQQGQFAHQNFASDWHRDMALLGGGPANGRHDPVDADRQSHQDFMAAMSGQHQPLPAAADPLPRHDTPAAHPGDADRQAHQDFMALMRGGPAPAEPARETPRGRNPFVD